MREIIFYVAVILVSVIIMGVASNITRDRCEAAGGQVIERTTSLDTMCIFPSKK